MNLKISSRVGKKYAVYLPKIVVRALGLKEGDKIVLTVSGNSLVIEKVHDPIRLAVSGSKFASLTPKEVEAVSLEEQRRQVEDSP